jgi:Repeat of unknown function (DUF346)
MTIQSGAPHAAAQLSWTSLGGDFTSGPTVAVTDGRLDVFVRGIDNTLMHRIFTDTDGWSPEWESLGGVLASDPDAGWRPGALDVFARGDDDTLIHRWFTPSGGWSGWESLGGTLTSGPTEAIGELVGLHRLDIFARGSDNTLMRRTFTNHGWLEWESLGGTLASDPDAGWRPGALYVFALATDNTVMYTILPN